MSDEEYFSSKYSHYLSNSRIGLLNPDEGGSFEKFERGYDSKYSDSFALGGAVHCKVLQEDEFEIATIQKPNGKLGVFIEALIEHEKKGLSRKDAAKQASIDTDYYSKNFTDKRLQTAMEKGGEFYEQKLVYPEDEEGIESIFLSVANYEKYLQIMDGIARSKIGNYINPLGLLDTPESYNEYAIFCDLEVIDGETTTIVPIKGKIDNFTVCHENEEIVLNDLKTTGKPVLFFMGGTDKEGNWYDGSMQKFRYYRQMGLYGWLLMAAMKQIHGLEYKFKANMLVVETIPDFRSKIYKVTNSHIKAGMQEFKELIKGYVRWKNK